MKNLILALSMVVLLGCGVYAALAMYESGPVYDGSGVEVTALYENPENYDNSTADSAAAVIVNENLEKTAATNAVFSVVFNFRGYDTLGESFILIAAVSGSMAILRKAATKRKETEEGEKGAEEDG